MILIIFRLLSDPDKWIIFDNLFLINRINEVKY